MRHTIPHLGYEWSSSKGDEGIKLIKDANDHHLTPLYDEANRANATKVNCAIAQNYGGTLAAIPSELTPYLSLVPLAELVDFSRTAFEKQISLRPTRKKVIESKWPLLSVLDLADVIGGGTPDTQKAEYWDGDVPWLSVTDFGKVVRWVSSAEKSITKAGLENSSTKLLQPRDIIISARGTVGAMAQVSRPMAFNQSCYGLRAKKDVTTDYLFYVLKHEIEQLKEQATGSKFDSITTKMFGASQSWRWGSVPKVRIIPVFYEDTQAQQRSQACPAPKLSTAPQSPLELLSERLYRSTSQGSSRFLHRSIMQMVPVLLKVVHFTADGFLLLHGALRL